MVYIAILTAEYHVISVRFFVPGDYQMTNKNIAWQGKERQQVNSFIQIQQDEF